MGCGASSKGKYKASSDVEEDRDLPKHVPSSASITSIASKASGINVSATSSQTSRASLMTWASEEVNWKGAQSRSFSKDVVSTRSIALEYDTKKWSDRLGKGASGSVYRATQKSTDSHRAVKKCYKVRPDDTLGFKREAALMANICHPNIIQIFEFFEDKWCAYFVFELCEGGELLKKISQDDAFTEQQCAHIMRQILRGVSYLHGRRICHRDLKPDNFLISENVPMEESILKIIDFGCATHLEPGHFLTTPVGTVAYMAPEVFSGRYHLKCDIWSSGVVAYFLLCGDLPWSIDELPVGKAMSGRESPKYVSFDSNEALTEIVKVGKYSLEGEIWQHASEEAKDFIAKLMTFVAEDRCSGKDALKHLWLKHNRGVSVNMPVLANLKSYWNVNHGRTSAMDDMSRQLSPAGSNSMLEAFERKDVNKLGKLSVDDITAILQQSGMNLPDEHIVHLVKSWDSDGNGEIDYDEFATGMRQSHAEVEEQVCMAAFSQIDLDGDGILSPEEVEASREELLQILSTEGVLPVVAEDTDNLLKKIPTNAEGEISFHEFLIAVTGHAPTRFSGRYSSESPASRHSSKR